MMAAGYRWQGGSHGFNRAEHGTGENLQSCGTGGSHGLDRAEHGTGAKSPGRSQARWAPWLTGPVNPGSHAWQDPPRTFSKRAKVRGPRTRAVPVAPPK